MKIGDLIYHVDDWADKKPIVGVVVGLGLSAGTGNVRVLFTDKVEVETWPERELRHVER